MIQVIAEKYSNKFELVLTGFLISIDVLTNFLNESLKTTLNYSNWWHALKY